MSSNETSTSTTTSKQQRPPPEKPLLRTATLPLTTTVVEIVGQVPEPLSPSDKKPTAEEADNSLSTAILEQRKAVQSDEAHLKTDPSDPIISSAHEQQQRQQQQQHHHTSGISLPLPASSSLVEPEPPFPRLARTHTAPLGSLAATSGDTISPQVIPSAKTFPVTDTPGATEGAVAAEPTPTMDGQQPLIAELPGTPVPADRPAEGADTQRVDREIASEQKASAARSRAKSGDAAVLYDIPVTPSAQAFEEVAKHNNIGKGYFEPIFPEEQGGKVKAT